MSANELNKKVQCESRLANRRGKGKRQQSIKELMAAAVPKKTGKTIKNQITTRLCHYFYILFHSVFSVRENLKGSGMDCCNQKMRGQSVPARKRECLVWFAFSFPVSSLQAVLKIGQRSYSLLNGQWRIKLSQADTSFRFLPYRFLSCPTLSFPTVCFSFFLQPKHWFLHWHFALLLLLTNLFTDRFISLISSSDSCLPFYCFEFALCRQITQTMVHDASLI